MNSISSAPNNFLICSKNEMAPWSSPEGPIFKLTHYRRCCFLASYLHRREDGDSSAPLSAIPEKAGPTRPPDADSSDSTSLATEVLLSEIIGGGAS